MTRFVRRAVIGSLAGGVVSAALIATLGHAGGSLLLGAAIGVAFAVTTGPSPNAYVDSMMAAGALGVPLWGIFSVIIFPLLSRQVPQ